MANLVTNKVIGVLLEDKALSLEELARACAVEPDWVVQRVQTGVLLQGTPPGQAGKWLMERFAEQLPLLLERGF